MTTRIQQQFEEGWFNELKNFLDSDEFDKILKEVYYISKRGNKILPTFEETFNAFKYCPFNKTKVVILGQGPYPDPKHAHGLAFSSKSEFSTPASLNNIFKEIENDVYGEMKLDQDPNLIRWAEQGVLLLNTSLTIDITNKTEHQKLWEPFIKKVLDKLPIKDIVYILWGKHAKKYKDLMNFTKTDLILESLHPSPLSAHRGFFGNKHFSKTNEHLKKLGKDPIEW